MADPAEPRGARNQPTRAQGIGRGGEHLAARWLEARGLRILARNWRCADGEIDLIASDGDEVVFIEVKTRHGTRLGAPEEAITPRKRRHLLAAASAFMAERGADDAPYRIDVLAIQLGGAGAPYRVSHYERAIAQEDG